MIISRQSRANQAATLWRIQYPPSRLEHVGRVTLDKLITLGRRPKIEDVVQLIGESWVRITCDLCKHDVCQAAVFSGYEESIYVCEDCLHAELKEFAQ